MESISRQHQSLQRIPFPDSYELHYWTEIDNYDSSIWLITHYFRAAFIHVIGDFIQSLGVFIAALVIYFYPHLIIIDPICTFIFSVLVLLTTIRILKDTMNVLMEGKKDLWKLDCQNLENECSALTRWLCFFLLELSKDWFKSLYFCSTNFIKNVKDNLELGHIRVLYHESYWVNLSQR